MKNKLIILFVGPLPPPYSGPELSMADLLYSKFLNSKYEIIFLKTNFRNDNVNKGKLDFAMIRNFFNYFFNLTKLLAQGKPHVVYYPITPTQVGWLGRDIGTILLSKFFGAKVIIHLRGSHFKLNFTRFHKFSRLLIGNTLKRVDRAIVQANYLKDQFSPYINPEKVSCLYQSMDFNKFKPGLHNNIKKNFIFIVGHLTKSKGYTDILKVIPEIADLFPDITFNFAGDMRTGERGVFYNQTNGEKIIYEDPFQAEQTILNSQYKLNYRNLGLITGKDKQDYFQKADIFLSASYSEGFSRSLLEAMAVGKPIIFTPVGAHKEVYSKANGNSFMPGDLQGMKRALISTLKNKERFTMGAKNREYAIQQFSIEKICEDFSNILNQTLRL